MQQKLFSWFEDRVTLSQLQTWYCHAFAILFIFAAMHALEDFDQNYFNQSDNFIQFAPIMIAAARNFFDHGQFPFWDPYQLMGMPVMQQGIYAITYPPMYLSYAIARYLWGDEAAILNAFFMLHAVAAYAATNLLLKGMRISLPLRIAANLSYIFVGYYLVTGRSWYNILPPMLWCSVIFLGIFYRSKWSRWRWIIITGLGFGCYYHAGNLQMYIYSAIFYGIAWVWLLFTGEQKSKLIADTLLAALLTLAIAMPLIVPQYLFLITVNRAGGYGHGVESWQAAKALFLPHPLADAHHPHHWDGRHGYYYAGFVYYGSMLFEPAALLGIAAWLLQLCRLPRKALHDPLFPLTIIVILIANCMAGQAGWAWPFMLRLPLFEKFECPFRFIPFFHFFLILIGVICIQRVCDRLPRQSWQTYSRRAVFCMSMILTTYSLTLAKAAIEEYLDRSYRPMPSDMAEQLSPQQRHYHWWKANVIPNAIWTLSQNTSSVYGYFDMLGFDQFAAATPEMRKFFGNCHYWSPFFRNLDCFFPDRMREAGVSDMIYDAPAGTFKIMHLDHPQPLSSYQATGEKIPFTVDWHGITIGATGQTIKPESIMVNFVWRPGFQITDNNGRNIRFDTDNMSRILLFPRRPATTIRLKYIPPGLYWGLRLSFLCFMLFGLFYRRRSGEIETY